MRTYLLLRNNRKSGPYTYEELLCQSLKPQDLIWVEGKSSAWRYPTELPDFSNLASLNLSADAGLNGSGWHASQTATPVFLPYLGEVNLDVHPVPTLATYIKEGMWTVEEEIPLEVEAPSPVCEDAHLQEESTTRSIFVSLPQVITEIATAISGKIARTPRKRGTLNGRKPRVRKQESHSLIPEFTQALKQPRSVELLLQGTGRPITIQFLEDGENG